MVHTAQFPGSCASLDCGTSIEVGDPVRFVQSAVIHAACVYEPVLPDPGDEELLTPDDVRLARSMKPISRKVCQTCFIETDIGGGCFC